jgi:putative salt-induced outer membrane protein YdiY
MKKLSLLSLFSLLIFLSLAVTVQAEETKLDWKLHSPYFDKNYDGSWKIHNTLKAGAVITAGNSQNFTVNADETLTVRKDKVTNIFNGGAIFARSKSQGSFQTTAQYFYLNDRLEWAFHPKWFTFVGAGWLTDKLNGMDQKYRGLLGVGHYFVETTNITLQARLGYTIDRELRTAPDTDRTIQSGTTGYTLSWKMNEHVSLNNSSNLYANLTDIEDLRWDFNLELQAQLVEHLSLALGSQLNFDNQPVTGFGKWDFIQTLSVVLDF